MLARKTKVEDRGQLSLDELQQHLPLEVPHSCTDFDEGAVESVGVGVTATRVLGEDPKLGGGLVVAAGRLGGAVDSLAGFRDELRRAETLLGELDGRELDAHAIFVGPAGVVGRLQPQLACGFGSVLIVAGVVELDDVTFDVEALDSGFHGLRGQRGILSGDAELQVFNLPVRNHHRVAPTRDRGVVVGVVDEAIDRGRGDIPHGLLDSDFRYLAAPSEEGTRRKKHPCVDPHGAPPFIGLGLGQK